MTNPLSHSRKSIATSFILGMVKDKHDKWTKYVNNKMEKYCAMKSLIYEIRWDTDVSVSDAEVGMQRTPARLYTKLQYCGGKPACLRCQEEKM
jgi:hypothetical protein